MNGDIIKKELKRTGLTQKELAKLIYVTPQAVSKWINNLSQPTFDNIKNMSEVFGVNLAEKIIASERKREKMTEHATLPELDSIEKAENEAVLILNELEIDIHYPYHIYLLLKWLITATIGLTYHNYLLPKEDEDESRLTYNEIYFFLNNYFEICYQHKYEYKNQLEYDFFLMGGDLFESFEPNKLPNHDYCYSSMDLWYKFNKAFDEREEGIFKTALIEIIYNNSYY